ncbi:MAG: (2Fe-2S) ferredoxin domain-containing protein [Planctomycetota bacterium]
MPKFERHIFVCENERPEEHPRGSCSRCGGAEVRAALKVALSERGLKGKVRANSAGCLDQCAFGSVLVIYPEQTWYGGVTPDDVTEILDALEHGEVVKRLVIDADVLNTPEAKMKSRPD